MLLRRLRKDQRGVAAVEFALIAPVAILLYCGFAELTMAMMAERRAAHAVSVVADLVAQSTQITKIEMDDVVKVGSTIMSPFPTTPLLMRLTSVTADAKGVPQMTWSKAYGIGAMPTGPVSGFPPNLLTAGDSVIQADMKYTYTSPLLTVLPTPLKFSQTFYLRPRRSPSVAFN
jgi:Flp pilus assembly protein TadG